jgi:hypothetical protein
MFCHHREWISAKAADQRTNAETEWLVWAERRIAELEGSL